MEHWQNELIRQNLPELIQFTDFNAIVRASLVAENVLSEADTDLSEAKRNLLGRLEHSNFIYNVLKTRKLAYEKLVKVLFQTHQYKAVEILLTGFELQGNRKGLSYCGIIIQKGHSIDCEIVESGRRHKVTDFFKIESIKQTQDIFWENLSELSYYNAFVSKDETFVLVNDTIPQLPSFYVPRLISNRVILDKNAFKACFTDVFVFKCLERHELSQLAKPHCTASSKSQLEKLTSRFILLECDDDWRDLVNKATVPIHLVKHEANQNIFILENTTGISDFLQEYVSKSSGIYMTEEDFIKDQDNNLANKRGVCICDTPGMGKTSLFASLAKGFAADGVGRVIAFIKLAEFLPNIGRPLATLESQNYNGLLHVFQHISPTEDAAKILFQLAQNGALTLLLLFDGFDEIQADEAEFVKNIFKQMASTFPNITFYVTSRPHMRQELETTLGVLAFDILPFDTTGQINYLVKVWSNTLPPYKQEALETYARNVMTVLKKAFSSSTHHVAGIPLLCQLISEVYSREAERFCKSENRDFRCTPRTICHMYKSFIYSRISSLTSLLKSPQNDDTTATIQNIKDAHIFHAWNLIFPNKPFPLGQTSDKYGQFNESILLKAGILQKRLNGGRTSLEFIHRTFAEHLIAELLADLLLTHPFSQKGTEKYLDFILNTVLDCSNGKNFQHPVVVYFLKSLLCRININSITFGQAKLWNSICTSNLSEKLISSCSQNFLHIFRLLKGMLLNCPKHEFQDYQSILTSENSFGILSAAIQFSDMQMFHECLDLFRVTFGDKSKNLFAMNVSKHGRNSLLQDAVSCCNYEVVEYLIETCDLENQDILKKCTFRSYFDSCEAHHNRKRLLQLLLAKKNLIHEAPNILVSSTIHVEIIKILIRNGANLKATIGSRFEGKHNLIQYASTYMSPSDYHELTHFLLDERHAEYLFKDHPVWGSPLSFIIERIDLLPETLALILTIPEINIHSVNQNGENLLVNATRGSRLVSLMKLVELKVPCDMKLKNQMTLLHVAAKSANTETMKYLLSLGLKPNLKNINGDTPLHISTNGLVATANKLIEHGAVIAAKNKKLEIPLHHACIHGNTEMINYLLSIEADIHAVDILGNTPSHVCKDPKAIKYLISAGANVFVKNKNGDSVIYLYSKFCSKNLFNEIVSLLVDMHLLANFDDQNLLHKLLQRNLNMTAETLETIINTPGLDINVANADGIEPIWLAAQWCDLSLLRCLVKNGANHSFQDKEGLGLLHLAAQRNDLDILRYLSAFKDIINQKDDRGNTPLYYCISSNAVSALIESGASVMEQNDNGDTFLHTYMKNTNTEVRELLNLLARKENTIQVFNVPNHGGQTVFYFCLRSYQLLNDILPFIKNIPDANINKYEKNGDNLITLAAGSCNVDIMRALIQHGANYTSLNKKRQNLLQIAYTNKKIEIAYCCLELGLDPLQADDCNVSTFWLAAEACDIDFIKAMHTVGVNIHPSNNKGQNLLHIAIYRWNLNLINYCLENGLDPNKKDNQGNSPLFLVAKGFKENQLNDRLLIMEHLFKRGANLKSENNLGHNLFHVSVLGRSIDFMSHCCTFGVDINFKDKRGNTPFLLAAKDRNIIIMEKLVELGADFRLSNNKGKNVFHIAASSADLNLVEYCIKLGLDPNEKGDYTKSPIEILMTTRVSEKLEKLAKKYTKTTNLLLPGSQQSFMEWLRRVLTLKNKD